MPQLKREAGSVALGVRDELAHYAKHHRSAVDTVFAAFASMSHSSLRIVESLEHKAKKVWIL
jgi:hypothetical protein